MTARRWSLREQQLALAALWLIAVWGVMSWLGLPRLTQLQQLHQRRLVARQRLARLQALARRAPPTDPRPSAVVGDPAVADISTMDALLETVERLAAADQLPLTLRPRPVRREGEVARLDVELELEGTQAQLVGWLERVLTDPSLLELERLRLWAGAADPAHPDTLHAAAVVTKTLPTDRVEDRVRGGSRALTPP